MRIFNARLFSRLTARSAGHFPIMTSVDLMITVTASPALRASRSAEPLLISETISWPATSRMTSAMMVPNLTLLTLPLS